MRALGQFEQLIATRDRTKEPALSRPLSGLSPRWIDYCDDGGVEVRLAAALASIRSTGSVGPLRSNMAEIDPEKPWRWDAGKGDRYWFGNDLTKRLGGVLSRRIMDATRRSAKKFPAEGILSVSCQDVMPFLWGLTDDEKMEELLWGFNLIDWRKAVPPELAHRWKTPVSEQPITRSYSILKLLHSPRKIQDIEVRTEPRIINLLAADRIEEACRLAVQRLHASRLSPHMIGYDKDVDSVPTDRGDAHSDQGSMEARNLGFEGQTIAEGRGRHV